MIANGKQIELTDRWIGLPVQTKFMFVDNDAIEQGLFSGQFIYCDHDRCVIDFGVYKNRLRNSDQIFYGVNMQRFVKAMYWIRRNFEQNGAVNPNSFESIIPIVDDLEPIEVEFLNEYYDDYMIIYRKIFVVPSKMMVNAEKYDLGHRKSWFKDEV